MEKIKTILIVDDEFGFCREIDELLKDEGFKTVIAYDGVSALKLLEVEDIDLLLTDIYMPKKDGLELAVEVKKSKPKVKIVIMTGGDPRNEISPDQDSYIQILEKYGKFTVLRKPFKSTDLVKAIVTQLGN